MSTLLGRLFKIHQGEAGKVAAFALLGGVLEAGVAVGISTADTLFLVHVGAENLPAVYIILPLIMIAFTPLFSHLGGRWGVGPLFRASLAAILVGGVVCFVGLLVIGRTQPWFFYAVKLYAALWSISLFTLFWNFVDAYFVILDAKRLFAVLSGGAALGAALGGGLVGVWASSFQVAGLFLVWSALAAAAVPVTLYIQRKWRRLQDEEEVSQGGFLAETVEVLGTVNRSRYVALLNLALMLTVFLATLCEFQYLGILGESAGEQELAALLGLLFAAANGFNLLVNFFLFSRMVTFLGVRNVMLVQPLVWLGAFAMLYFHYGWTAAVVGFFAFQGVQSSVENNNWNFVVNGIPADRKAAVRTFLEGITEPAAASLAGLFLLLFAARFGPLPIAGTGLVAAGVLLVVAVLLRQDYLGAIVANLKREWLDFSRAEDELFGGLGPRDVDALADRVRDLDDRDSIDALRLLALNDPARALMRLVDLCGQREAGGRGLQDLLEEILEQADTETLILLVRRVGTRGLLADPAFVEVLGARGLIRSEVLQRLAESPDPNQQAAAAVASWNSWDVTESSQAIAVIRGLLEGGEEKRLAGIRALGRLGLERYAHYLAQFLLQPLPQIRHQALTAIRALAGRESGHLTPHLLRALEDADSRQRRLALEALAKIRDPSSLIPLFRQERKFTPSERRRLQQTILDMGLGSVPAVVTVLKDVALSYEARSINARALSRLAFPQFESLLPSIIETELERAYRFHYFHSVLRAQGPGGPGLTVLARLYADASIEVVEFVLEMLALGGRLPDFEMVNSSLRSASPRARANALESLEQGCDRAVFAGLLPLVDGRGEAGTVAFYLERYRTVEVRPEEIVRQGLQSTQELECAAALQAAWDRDRGACTELIGELVGRVRHPLVRDLALNLIGRDGSEACLNRIEVLFSLLETDFFRGFRSFELARVARHAVERSFPAGAVVAASEGCLFVVLEGELEPGGRGGRAGRGDLVGEEVLLGGSNDGAGGRSRGCRLLEIDGAAVLREAAREPRLARGLVGLRLERTAWQGVN